MPMSEAAIAGIRDNGREWKYRVPSMKLFSEILDEAIDNRDLDRAHLMLRGIANVAKAMVSKVPADDFSYMSEALEFFENETLDYEFENMDEEEIKENINYHLSSMYDYADYHRILVG